MSFKLAGRLFHARPIQLAAYCNRTRHAFVVQANFSWTGERADQLRVDGTTPFFRSRHHKRQPNAPIRRPMAASGQEGAEDADVGAVRQTNVPFVIKNVIAHTIAQIILVRMDDCSPLTLNDGGKSGFEGIGGISFRTLIR